MKNDLKQYMQLSFDMEEQKKRREQESRKRHKEIKCGSLQVFLEKEIVEEFKVCVKANGHSQAGVIRGFIKCYMAGSEVHGAG